MVQTFYHPLDPECMVVAEAMRLRDDPKVRVGAIVWDQFEHDHRLICERCQRYGAANIEARDDSA